MKMNQQTWNDNKPELLFVANTEFQSEILFQRLKKKRALLKYDQLNIIALVHWFMYDQNRNSPCKETSS